MVHFTRRKFLQSSTTAAAVSAGTGPLIWVKDAQAQWNNTIEKGAKLRVLRWKRFVQGDEDAYMANVKKFSEQFKVEVRVDHEGWEDVRPKAAVAANVGSGPDIILGTNDDANLYPDKLVDVTDLANYLGKKYGGWFPICEQYLKPDGKKWIGIPFGAAGNALVYRDSQVKAAGFNTFPKDTDGFLKLMQALKSHGGKLVDNNNKVVIDSPETVKALEYGRELYQTFVPGTLSWLDPSNNKAFIDGQLSLTANGISVYYAAKNSTDAKVKEMAADIQHSNMPIGPAGVPTEFNLFFNQMVFKYSKYPKAAKEFIRFMMEQEQYGPWMQAAIGYVAHPLKAYDSNPIWTVDPKHTPYRDAMKIMRPAGFSGKLGYASAGATADFIVVNMVAEAASGQKTPKEAATRAQQRAERYYKL